MTFADRSIKITVLWSSLVSLLSRGRVHRALCRVTGESQQSPCGEPAALPCPGAAPLLCTLPLTPSTSLGSLGSAKIYPKAAQMLLVFSSVCPLSSVNEEKSRSPGILLFSKEATCCDQGGTPESQCTHIRELLSS